MATFSDGPSTATLPVMPDFTPNALSSVGDMRLQLQNLLDLKEKQLQHAGTLGQRILAQQVELEERVRQLQEFEVDKGDDEDLDSDLRERYRDLSEAIKAWDTENDQLSSNFGPKHLTNGTQAVSPRTADMPRDSDRSKPGPSSAAQSRRAKNAAHRADDVEFAFEIGSGLLTEVRRLQSLLGERDKAIQDTKEEKDDLEKTIESLRSGLRAQEQSSDKFKEENWNLEVTLQEMRVQLSDSQAATQRLESEHKRLTKLLTAAREATDQHKNETERLEATLDEVKAKHETDVAQARKQTASLQRDKSDLQQTLDSMKAEAARANRRPRLGSPLTPNGSNGDAFTPRGADEDDLFSPTTAASTNRKKYDTSALFPVDELGYLDTSPDQSPLRPFVAPNHPSNEIEALQQRLAHAQRQINTLKGTLQREKEMRIEYSRKLESSPHFEGDEENFPEDDLAPSSRRLTPFRVGRGKGRGRGRGRGSLLHRLGQAAQSPTSDFNDNEDSLFDTPPPVPEIPLEFHDLDDLEDQERDEQEDNQLLSSPSLQVASNRTSVDGMDPVFANVLRRSSSQTSLPINRSPLRQSINARSSRGGTFPRRSRGGAAYQEPRPPSLVGQPELLAAELGLGVELVEGMEPLGEVQNEEHVKVDTAEFGCQMEPEEPSPPLIAISPPPPIQISPPTSEIAVQVEPAPAPKLITVETSIQTEGEQAPSRSEVGTQHESDMPLLVSVSVNTEQPAIMTQAQVQTQSVPMSDVETQTPQLSIASLPKKIDSASQTLVAVETQTPTSRSAELQFQSDEPDEISRRTTITQYVWDVARQKDLSGETTITQHRLYEGSDADDDDNDNETETGIETDADDYQDARASIMLTTPTYSNSDDFHSILTVTDNEVSESEDDTESIRVSRIPSRQGESTIPSASVVGEASFYRSVKTPSYESKAIETDEIKVESIPITEPRAVQPVELPMPELKEISIQTDEWKPPPPPTPAAVVPVSVSAPSTTRASQSLTSSSPKVGFGLYGVGPHSQQFQQFQFISPPSSASPTTTSIPIAPISSPNTTRDSHTTVLARPRTSQSDRRQSIESALSSADELSRPHATSGVLSAVDKSRPPMMMLPPPPRQPPPPGGIMLPPSIVPEKRISHDIPPPRPSSPPPPELIQRATTPTFGAVLSVPSGRASYSTRLHGSSMPPSQQRMRQPPSTSSFRSAANAAAHAQTSVGSPSVVPFGRGRKEMSTTSLVSGSFDSQRSSLSSDHHVFADASNTLPRASVAPERINQGDGTTDPTVIHAITQTMIGEFLYKYTRRTIGKGHGDRRHKRFFWVHPYTKTLYWSSADPGSSNVSESSAKSAYIESVRSVLDPNPMPPGLYQYSVVVSTPNREMKFTAPTKERHDIWLNALKYLLARPGPLPNAPGVTDLHSPMSVMSELPDDENQPNLMSSPQSRRSRRSTGTGLSGDSWNNTPKGQRSQSQLSLRGSMGKRSGTPAVEYLRWTERGGPYSPTRSFERVGRQDDEELDFELHDENMSDGGYEGLENVRACCDGRHTVGHHHHHDHNHDHTQQRQESSRTRDHLLDVNPRETSRPVSPAWSFRSRAGSAHSKEGQSIFSRFGSKRSTKTTLVNSEGPHDR